MLDLYDQAIDIICDMTGCEALTAAETLGELQDNNLIKANWESEDDNA